MKRSTTTIFQCCRLRWPKDAISLLHSSDSTHSVLVNERFVKSRLERPGGATGDFWYRPGENIPLLCGKDYHYESLNQEIGPELFTMKPGNDYGKALIKVKPGSETAALKQIEKVFKATVPG